MSPTQLTLREMRRRGYIAQVVEVWNPHAKIRQDLFKCIDVLAVGNGETVGIQCTSKSNIASRERKIAEADAVSELRDANWRLLVHGWFKRGHRWSLEERDIS